MEKEPVYSQFKKKKSSRFKRFRHWGQMKLLAFLIGLANLFPIGMAQFIGKQLGNLAYLLAKKDRGIALYQLEFSFPDKTDQERQQIVKECFQNFSQTFMEVLVKEKFRDQAEKWIKLDNTQVVHDALAEGKGAILLFGHFGNWELMPIVYEMLGIKGKAIARPVDTKGLDGYLASTRDSTHLQIIPRGNARSGKLMLQCFRNNEALLLGIDQDTKAQSVFVDFFGKKAKTPKVAGTFALKFSAPIIAAFGYRKPDGTHYFNFELVTKPPYEGMDDFSITEICSQAMERYITANPAQWAWFHRRWKSRPEDEQQ